MSDFWHTNFYEKAVNGGTVMGAVDENDVEFYWSPNADGQFVYTVDPNEPVDEPTGVPSVAAVRWDIDIYKCTVAWRRELAAQNTEMFHWRVMVTPDNGAAIYQADGRSATLKDAQHECFIWMNGNKEARRTYREVAELVAQ